MNHEQAGEELSAYLDGELAPEAKAALEAHLAECADCRSHLEELRASTALFKQHARQEPPPLLASKALAAALPAAAAARPNPPAMRLAAYSLAAVCGLVIGVAGLKKAMPGLFGQRLGMVPGAPMTLGAPAKPPRQAFAAAPPSAAGALAGAPAKAGPMNQLKAAAGLSRAGASYDGVAAGGSAEVEEEAESAQEAGPLPQQELFNDAAAFQARWKELTILPAPQVDFSNSRVLLLTGAPAGKVWRVVSVQPAAGRIVVIFGSQPLPNFGPVAPPIAPAFAVLPLSGNPIQLQPVR